MDYLIHLQKDKKLLPILTQPILLTATSTRVEIALIKSIIAQQLSTKVATVIKDRFFALFEGRDPLLEEIIATPAEKLQSIGLSKAKAMYVQNVAQFFIEKQIENDLFYEMENESIIKLLTEIKGVGRWTVEMLLMFTLSRPDVFAADDLNIQQTMMKLYGINGNDKKKLKEKMIKISNKWKPYRTYGCLHLWNWKDNC